jgi:hypothetical protein
VRRPLVLFAQLVVNAIPCALQVPLLILALTLLLNPESLPGPGGLAGAWSTLALAYGLPVLLLLPLGFTAVRFFAARKLHLDWIQVRAVLWFLVAGTAGMVCLFGWNLSRLGSLIGARPRGRLTAALVVLFAAWAAATILAVMAQLRREGSLRRRLIALVLLAACGPACLGLWAAGRTPPPDRLLYVPEISIRSGPVVVLGIEGASFSDLLPLVSEGRLPHLSRLLKEGAHGALRTLRPCGAAPAWASLSTGKSPGRNGVRDREMHTLAGLPGDLRLPPSGIFFRRWLAPGMASARVVEERDLLAKPLWRILDGLRVETVMLRWPISGSPGPAGLDEESAERSAKAREWLGRLRGTTSRVESGDAGADAEILAAVTRDLRINDALLRVASGSSPRFLGAYLPGLGSIAASYLKFVRPQESQGVAEEEIERYGHVLDRYYEMLDAFIGSVRAWLPDEGYLVIVSAYGTEPLGPLDRLGRRLAGLPPAAAGHDSGPAGILILDGPGVAPGKQADDLRVVDVVPLCLYLLGMPVGRDMDGRLPRQLFQRSFLESNAITFIPTYG